MLNRAKSFIRDLRRDDSGLALIEFALSLPIFTGLGMYGTEVAYLAIVNMEISQAALNLADNASRLGQTQNNVSSVSIKESDIQTAFAGLKLQTGSFDLLSNGRVILSSLERNSQGGQWIHWQRCLGVKNVQSQYGAEGKGSTGTAFAGMGDAGEEIQAQPNTAVMYVEVSYDYKGLFGDMFTKNVMLYQKAAHNIRDDRNLSGGLVNDVGTTQQTCDKYSAN
ncbi:TadE/TadG family type IV pilus assembly protein [Novosphingopyxis sp.]|uniref:TadE/TadG family type IV pilus assembly protein n=1 Tax=Novosphingopyxis sp. TaxID=2709690 RepID=UPI003B5973B7